MDDRKNDDKFERFSKLSQDLESAISDKRFSDIQLHCGDQVFDCHQVILAVRSPVFRAMFEADMKEKKTRKVDVKDIRPDVLSEALTFIYTGMTPNLDDLAEDLLVAADKYQLDQLKQICVNNLCKKIDVKTCLHSFTIGDMYNADDLKKSALQFIARNKEQVFKTKDWKGCLQKHLMEEVIETLSNVSPPCNYSTESTKLRVKVVGQDSNEIHFNVEQTVQLVKLKKSYSKRVGVPISILHFLFDGRHILDNETPEDLEMEQDDVIEVYMEQSA